MNVEEQRLRTFRDWPGNAAVESSRIAQAGFYFTGPGLEVTCFSCGCHISDWNYGDQVMTRHRSINPDCAFVRDPGSSGNIPMTVSRMGSSQSHSSSSSSSSPNRSRSRRDRGQWESKTSIYKSEAARLESFEGWPIPLIVSPEALAETGFYFLHQGDKVQCAFCNGILCSWELGDVPDVVHRRHFPACPLLSGNDVGNIPRGQSLPRASTGERLCVLDNLEELGIQRHKGPKHPKYSTIESRLRTFSNWPSDVVQQPLDLAQAGFFHVQSEASDYVRCFHCDGGLRTWDPEDEPWFEHAKWFPTCAFLLLVKGQEFVDEVQRLYGSGETTTTTATTKNAGEGAGTGGNTAADAKTSPLQGSLSVSMPSLSNSQPSEKAAEESTSRMQSTLESLSLEEENRRLREARQCKICMDAEVGAVLLPCGHLVACVDCAPSLQDCPVCRQQIKATIRTFLS